MMTVACMFTGSSSVVQIKRCVRDRVFAVIPAATGRGTYLTRDNRFADDQQEGRLLECGRCEIASPGETWLSFLPNLPSDLLAHSSDATGAAEVVAGESGIPALHHLLLVNVWFSVWVPDSASVQNGHNESLVSPFLHRCWCSAEIPSEEGASVVGLLGFLVDVLRPCTVLVDRHSDILCCVSHLQYMPVDIVLGDGRRWLTCDSQ